MAIINFINVSQTILDKRLSAEFYQPKYLIEVNGKYEWLKIGNCLHRAQYGISIKMNENAEGFKILRMNEIDNCFVQKAKKYANISPKEFKEFELLVNDVLFNRTNSFDFVGRTGIVKDTRDTVFASYLVRLNPKSHLILPEFLTLYLNTHYGIDQIKRRAMQSINQANVSAAEVSQIRIPLVDIAIQEEIASGLNESYHLISQSKSLYLNAQQLLEKELGIDKIEITESRFHSSTYSKIIEFNRFDSEYSLPKYSKLKGLISTYKKGFEYFLKNVDSVAPNINPKLKPNEYFNYIELSKINGALGLVDGSINVKGNKAPSRAQRLVQEGDIIASSVVGSVDKSALIYKDENGYLASTGFFQFRSMYYSPEYLLILIQSKLITDQLKQEATGGILSAVSNDNLRYLIIPTIPKELQDEITELVKKSHQQYKMSKRLLRDAIKKVEDLIKAD